MMLLRDLDKDVVKESINNEPAKNNFFSKNKFTTNQRKN